MWSLPWQFIPFQAVLNDMGTFKPWVPPEVKVPIGSMGYPWMSTVDNHKWNDKR